PGRPWASRRESLQVESSTADPERRRTRGNDLPRRPRGTMKRHIPLLLTLLLVSACTARSEIHVIFDSASSGVARVVTAGDSRLREAMASDVGGTPDWGDLEFVVEAFEGQ